MPDELGKQWFGATPPDLTLMARAKSTDYLYTYLRTFYEDPSASLWGEQQGVPGRRHAARAARPAGPAGPAQRAR